MVSAVSLLMEGLNNAKENKFEQSVCAIEEALGMNLTPDMKKAALMQIAISLSRLEEYGKAEGYLLKRLEISRDLDVLDLLATVYDFMGDKEKALEIYKEISRADTGNFRALMRVITSNEERDENEILEMIKYMDTLIAEGKLRLYDEAEIAAAFSSAYEAVKGMNDVDKALGYYDSYRNMLSPEERKTNESYRDMLAATFSLTIYSHHHSNEAQIGMMHEIYNLFKPTHVNSFTRCPSYFRDIKIGFLSSDFRFHPVGRFIFSLFMEKISNSGIDYYCYDTYQGEGDSLTELLQKNAFKYVSVGKMKSLEAEKIILEDNLDILFDLNGVSGGNKRSLVIRRLAPVQITWIGFPCTSAIQNVDYNLADHTSDPAGVSAKFYTERLAYLPKTFLCYPFLHDYSSKELEIKEAPVNKNGFITFGAFCNPFKFSPETIKMWAKVLENVPGCKLTIRGKNMLPGSLALKTVKQKFMANGLDITRVDFLPIGLFNEYLAFYNEVDIILDTFPFNGATTTCDAFIMGVPIVSMYGEKHVERVGFSMLKNVGLADLAASNEADFVRNAAQLANNTQRINFLRKTLRETFKKSPLGDTSSFKVDFENLMRKLHIRYHLESGINIEHGFSKKNENELISEILRGLHFIENMFYETEDKNLAESVKNALYLAQKEFLKRYAGEIEKISPEFLKGFTKYTEFYGKNLSFSSLKQLSNSGTDMFKKII
ncbi:MAG: hypothetical protein LBS21_00450 [Clostridiales bacterium]|jgi:predicted O-linked N-acetylglucosamine transferase (SPINDLY family)|nr:hypothetical protein [Clostridiales bacterium]